ncbi:hypothetical protein EDD18DRAFT_1470540 [Armillaria luteobubalina]|uniref:Uncharacterized protein n=1 Tax=Armillaria luteobubalina TaxID=153913 RepID=A0AA39NZY2_9AGAR|nr:hypothetical protein EDD18DRAFT_1470540 [Armillaria luteobubalina]
MVSQADIPPDLTDNDIALMFETLDHELNSKILFTLLYGIYTGILAITLWNIFINKCWPIRQAMIILIVLLYALITITFAVNWLCVHSAFVKNGQSFWTVFLTLTTSMGLADILEGIASSMSTILTDSYMIWCCWIVWGQHWPVVLLPILSLISAAVSKIIIIYLSSINAYPGIFLYLYLSCVLATTLWCTLLIIYHILTIAGAKHRENGQLGIYQHFLGVLVESSGLYTISLVVYLALDISGDDRMFYLDAIAAIAKGVALTLIIGCFAARHQACLNNSWQGSVIGSASIRLQGQEHSRARFWEDSDQASPMLGGDLEA